MKLVGEVETERDKIAIKLLFGTGMRVGELVTTKLEDVDTVEGIIHIHAARTKTRQYRDVVVLESIRPDLERWIESLPEGSIWLFPGRDPLKAHLPAVDTDGDRQGCEAGWSSAFLQYVKGWAGIEHSQPPQLTARACRYGPRCRCTAQRLAAAAWTCQYTNHWGLLAGRNLPPKGAGGRAKSSG